MKIQHIPSDYGWSIRYVPQLETFYQLIHIPALYSSFVEVLFGEICRIVMG